MMSTALTVSSTSSGTAPPTSSPSLWGPLTTIESLHEDKQKYNPKCETFPDVTRDLSSTTNFSDTVDGV